MAALILIYREKPEGRRSDGQHAFLCDAANVAAAIALVGVSPADAWNGVEVAATAALPDSRTFIRFEGDCISLKGASAGNDFQGISRGGNMVALD